MDIEQKIKNKLLIRGFSKDTLLNNRGLIGATTDETILEVVKNLGIANVSQQRELLKSCFLALDEVSRDNATITDEDAFIDEVIKDFNCG